MSNKETHQDILKRNFTSEKRKKKKKSTSGRYFLQNRSQKDKLLVGEKTWRGVDMKERPRHSDIDGTLIRLIPPQYPKKLQPSAHM